MLAAIVCGVGAVFLSMSGNNLAALFAVSTMISQLALAGYGFAKK